VVGRSGFVARCTVTIVNTHSVFFEAVPVPVLVRTEANQVAYISLLARQKQQDVSRLSCWLSGRRLLKDALVFALLSGRQAPGALVPVMAMEPNDQRTNPTLAGPLRFRLCGWVHGSVVF
jgi:hypothetical protein